MLLYAKPIKIVAIIPVVRIRGCICPVKGITSGLLLGDTFKLVQNQNTLGRNWVGYRRLTRNIGEYIPEIE